MSGLGGRVIACLEARYEAELADLVTRHGGITYPAPCLREVHEPDAAETLLAVDLIADHRVDAVVFLTGVGVATIEEGARRAGRHAAFLAGLEAMRVAARGPKTHNALRRLGVRVDLVAPEPYTSDALLIALADTWDVRDQTVLVQRYGGPVPHFTDGLRAHGARVAEVSPYRWERPRDVEPVVRLIDDLAAGWIDVLAATSAAQVDYLFEIAQERAREQALRKALETPTVRVAAQGVVCASAFERRGIQVDLIPPHASMGALIVEIANQLGRPIRGPARASDGVVAVFAGGDVELNDVRRVLNDLSADAVVCLLAGKSHAGDRLVEQASVERGLATRRVSPARDSEHPADEMIRRADRVLIVRGPARVAGFGRLLRLAERYAKSVQVIDATLSHRP